MHGTGKIKRKLIEKLSSELTEPAEQRSASAGLRCWVSTQFVCSIVLALIIVFFVSTAWALAEDARRVLVLNSYHPHYYWTEVTMSGIESAFEDYEGAVVIDVEYMDTKRFKDRTHYENLYALLKNKARSKRYDVIITNDNNALLFLLQYRDDTFPNVPIVFCGVDTFHCSMYEWRPSQCSIENILQGNEQVTGVIEELHYESTVATALRLHPSAKRMIFVNDGINEVTYWPHLTDEDIAEIAKGYEDRVEFTSFLLIEHNSDELLKEIQRREDESILLLTGNFLDEEGNLVLSQPGLSEFWSQCKVPAYSFTREMLERGFILGGSILSSYLQGETAARMAIEILEGSNADEIGILQSSPAEYMFDYVRLKEFGIRLSDLPEGSIVINQPETFYYRYKGRIWAVILLIGVLTGMVAVLSVNTIRRRTAEKALREGEERLRVALSAAQMGTWRWDPTTNQDTRDASFNEILGLEAVESTQPVEDFLQRVHPEDRDMVDGEIQRSLREHCTYVAEFRIIHPDGTVCWLRDQGKPVYDENDHILYLTGAVVDITEHKKAEEALRESEERYRVLFEGSAEGIIAADIETKKFKYANPAMCRMLGYTKEELTRMGVQDVHPKEDLERVISEFEAQARGDKTLALNIPCLCKDGTIIYADINTARVVIDGKEYNVGFFADITERKHAEEELKDSEEKFRTLYDSTSDAVMLLDEKSFFDCNEATLRIFGCSNQEEFCSNHPADLSPRTQPGGGTSLVLANKHIATAMKEGSDDFEWIHKRTDGSEFPAEVLLSRIELGGKKVLQAVVRDITERKQAEEKLQKARNELEIRVKQRTADLAQVVKELEGQIAERKRTEEKLLVYQKELRSLASALSLAEERLRRRIARNVHDNIGQSLAMSKIKLESLRESISSPKLVKLLQESCELLTEAIENSRSLTTELSPPVLYELGFEAALEWLVKNARQQYGFSAEFEDDGENKPISVDISVMLFQAVRELLVNVAKHARAKNVSVWAQKTGDEIQIGIEDNGVGFDGLKEQSRSSGTSGFGLFSIRERIGFIGGRLEINSKLGGGTRVTLTAPLEVENPQKGKI